MKATAIAPANIAFIKYWGRKDAKLRLPYNPSISMNLSACLTTTTVEFSSHYEKDTVSSGFDERRIIEHIDRLRKIAESEEKVKVTTKNNFPKSAGIASSASGFAALTVAGAAALGLKLSEKELTALARLGSGSACRSVPDGFVKWEGEYARSLYSPNYWNILDILVISDTETKKISSSAGHDLVETSPNFAKRLEQLPRRIARLEDALKAKNFALFGEIIEEECLDMHHVMQTQTPPLFYWNEITKDIMNAVASWRKNGLPVYFTIDAGPNVHLICEGKDEGKVLLAVKGIRGVQKVIVNRLAEGAHVI
ncbi:MAG: diphosphomevalonate decarboxylase [Candidatus Gottesmanbacteria bacterium]|nr:diphosphomevalonate decarboxylase [Candidatus Gottesmanbacteria bacterium]